MSVLTDPVAIDQALDQLYRENRSDLGELFSAACDPDDYIFCDADIPQRLVKAGLLTEHLALPVIVRTAVNRNFCWAD